MQEDINDKKPNVCATQIGLHSIKNLLGHEQQLTLFSPNKRDEFAKDHGIQIDNDISRFGVELTDTQQRIMEAILLGFSKTKYEGNVEPQDKDAHAKGKYASGKLPTAYKYINKFPRLRATQSEILTWAGISKNSAGMIEDATKAIHHLATAQYCFYYTRLALDENGDPMKDKDGYWKKEEVMGVDTLFTISFVRDEKTQNLQYYEIVPSALFLDQRESYFMLIPYNWREEVRKLVGQKKASSYTFRFLLFLRYQFELKRRAGNEKKPYSIRWSADEIAIALKMPESIYRRQKARALKILDEVYEVAQKLGYLTSYERKENLDVLILNEEKYYSPRNQEEICYHAEEATSPDQIKAKELYDLLILEKKKLDSRYNPPAGGPIQRSSLEHLVALVKERSFEEIKEVLIWGIHRPYWCNRIGTPSKLRKHFSEAVMQMNASKNERRVSTAEEREAKNKAFVAELAKKLKMSGKQVAFEVFNKYVEIGEGTGAASPICINYAEHGFEEQVINALNKKKIPVP